MSNTCNFPISNSKLCVCDVHIQVLAVLQDDNADFAPSAPADAYFTCSKKELWKFSPLTLIHYTYIFLKRQFYLDCHEKLAIKDNQKTAF